MLHEATRNVKETTGIEESSPVDEMVCVYEGRYILRDVLISFGLDHMRIDAEIR